MTHQSSFMSRKVEKVAIWKSQAQNVMGRFDNSLCVSKKLTSRPSRVFWKFSMDSESILWILEVIFRLWPFKRTNSRHYTTLRKLFGSKQKFVVFRPKNKRAASVLGKNFDPSKPGALTIENLRILYKQLIRQHDACKKKYVSCDYLKCARAYSLSIGVERTYAMTQGGGGAKRWSCFDQQPETTLAVCCVWW